MPPALFAQHRDLSASAARRALGRATRTICIRDIPYEVHVTTTYHPAFSRAAAKRLAAALSPAAAAAVRHLLQQPAATRVWGILLEQNGAPLLVAQNLGCAKTSPPFRRFLRVNLDKAAAAAT